jgi:hypothetical protein
VEKVATTAGIDMAGALAGQMGKKVLPKGNLFNSGKYLPLPFGELKVPD